jgi:hypothetical protein
MSYERGSFRLVPHAVPEDHTQCVIIAAYCSIITESSKMYDFSRAMHRQIIPIAPTYTVLDDYTQCVIIVGVLHIHSNHRKAYTCRRGLTGFVGLLFQVWRVQDLSDGF